jgi:hypothetical protein
MEIVIIINIPCYICNIDNKMEQSTYCLMIYNMY